MNERYTLISPILSVVSDFSKRNQMLSEISLKNGICRQTLVNYLCLYLSFQTKTILAPKHTLSGKVMAADEKNFRWALNKFFYTQNKNSLNTTYMLMLKEKYCNKDGMLLQQYPTFSRFRYFYRKTKKLQNYYISREGIKKYQRDHRPLLGDGVQEFAPHIGVGMLDATICDIYLINESGNLVGRPILTVCIDTYSRLCCGYSLSWEGGLYSLRNLMINIITDKRDWCKQYGIMIEKIQWDCTMIPATLVTDMGSEYKSENFEQLAELGIKIVNLPLFRPELKGVVEKFFDVIQSLFKPFLKGKGIVEPNFQERGVRDYRKDACLTMTDFEKIILRCIIYYNSQKVLENYPYTDKMLTERVEPHANAIWNFGKTQLGANLISVDKETLILTLLPRTSCKFCKNGLIVNKIRYKHEDYTEKYLMGGEGIVAYNPDNVSHVWLIENGRYIRFDLIEKRYKDKMLQEVEQFITDKKSIIRSAQQSAIQAKIDLAEHILTIAENAKRFDNISVKEIRNTRKKERDKRHTDFVEAGMVND